MKMPTLSQSCALLITTCFLAVAGCSSGVPAGGAPGAPAGGLAGCGGAGAEVGPVDCQSGSYQDPVTKQCKRFTREQRRSMSGGTRPTNVGP